MAEVREWMLQSIPQTRSAAGFDVFLAVAGACRQGTPVAAAELARVLPHAPRVVRSQLRRLQQAGLLASGGGGGAGGEHFAPTARLQALVDEWQREVESRFIARAPLREEQLQVHTRHALLAPRVAQLYDRFFDLGWLYLHRFGATCFLTALLVARIASLHGHRTRVVSGWAEVRSPRGVFALGAPGHLLPGEIEGHAMCVVDDRVVVDFGLGNLRRGYRRDFVWALAADLAPAGAVLAQAATAPGETLRWRDDWRYPGTEAKLASYGALVERLVADYLQRYPAAGNE